MERMTTAEHKAYHLARIKERKQRARLTRAIATYHRKHPELRTTPIIPDKLHAPLPLLGDDRTEPELQILLESVPESYRLDVAAQCWIVRADHPSIPALHVFRRSLEICRMVRRGVYSDAERIRQAKTGLPETMASATRQSAINSAKWYLEQGYNVLRRDRLQFVAMLVQSQLEPAIVEGILQGMTQKEIAEKTGMSRRTICNRIDSARDYAPAIAASAPLLRYRKQSPHAIKPMANERGANDGEQCERR